MSDVTTNLANVLSRIEDARAASGRAPGSVRLVAVSKTKPAAAIREAYAAGQRDFGENYAQELAEKAEELRDLLDLRWHFIGHLQSNKAKVIAPLAALVHTVDSPALARELAKRTPEGRRLPVLVEVNVGGEAQKSGIAPDAALSLVDAIAAEPRLELRGLMTIPPPDPEATRRAFAALAALQTRLGGAARLPELSMGMSDDLELAIAAGATLVRVGTAIFGARS
jgi:hypothetical protein